MVGESVAIDRSLIVAPGLPSAIFRVFFHQEGFVHHPALPHPWQQRSAHEDVVEACPPTLIPVGGARSVGARGIARYVCQAVLLYNVQRRLTSVGIEVAEQHYLSITFLTPYGVGELAYSPCHVAAQLPCSHLATPAARSMGHDDVQRVAPEELALGI